MEGQLQMFEEASTSTLEVKAKKKRINVNAKGAKGERDVCEFINTWAADNGVSWKTERFLREGRLLDCGDIDGLPGVTVQVKTLANVANSLTQALKGSVVQAKNAGNSMRVGIVKVPGMLNGYLAIVPVDDPIVDRIAVSGLEIMSVIPLCWAQALVRWGVMVRKPNQAGVIMGLSEYLHLLASEIVWTQDEPAWS